MNKVMKKDIDFSSLMQLQVSCNESILWHDDKNLYKIFKNVSKKELKEKQLKLNILDGFECSNVLTSETLIFEDKFFYRKQFSGYIRQYIKAKPLFQFYLENGSISLFLKIIKDVSITLKKIHSDPRNIAIGDFHFGNILIDDEFNHYFIDVDSYIVDGIPTLSFPNIFWIYSDIRGVYKDFASNLGQKTDKLILMMLTICILFDNINPNFLQIEKYDERSEQIQTLKNMREFFLKIKNKSIYIPDVPYIDELISDEDINICKKIVKF